jgi:hypothetical protein
MNDIKINNVWIGLRDIMKLLNFVEDVGFYTRKFTRIYVENNELYIGHTINKNKTKIEYEHLNEWIKYFDRI